MKTIINRPLVAAAIGLVGGVVLGSGVATAMGWDLDLYKRFVGACVITAAGVVSLWAYRTYIRPTAPVVEETDAEVSS